MNKTFGNMGRSDIAGAYSNVFLVEEPPTLIFMVVTKFFTSMLKFAIIFILNILSEAR